MLPKQFIPTQNYDLIRIGSKGDGGYLVERQSIKNSKVVVGLGLNDNWSFEKDILSTYKIPIVGFDCILSTKYLIQQAATHFLALYKFYEPERFCHFAKSIFKIFDYQKYKGVFHKKFIGYSLGSDYLSLTQLIEQYVKESPVFLKCDIEGWEYRILEDIITHAHSLSGLAIEFHDVDLHKERIISFIERLPLTVVHIHPNNCGPMDGNHDPISIELTFAKDPAPINNRPYLLPHKLDTPNTTKVPDIKIAL